MSRFSIALDDCTNYLINCIYIIYCKQNNRVLYFILLLANNVFIWNNSLAAWSRHSSPSKPETLVLKYHSPLFNLCHCNLPAIWKLSIITLVPKPDEQNYLGTSYHPTSLCCPAVKVLKRPLSPNQLCFRPNNSIVSALLPLAHKIAQPGH